MNIPKNCSTSYSTYLTRLLFIICVQTVRYVFRVKRCFYLSDITVEASVLCAVERSHFWRWSKPRLEKLRRLLRKFYESNNEDNSGTASSSSISSSTYNNNPINIMNINYINCTMYTVHLNQLLCFSISLSLPKVLITSNRTKMLLYDINTLLALLQLDITQGDGSKASSFPASRIWPQSVIAPSNHTILSQVWQH
jgi:hypothetical protein